MENYNFVVRQVICPEKANRSSSVHLLKDPQIKTYKKNGGKCCFSGCQNSRTKSPKLHFFKFPVSRPEVCKKWIVNCANKAVASLSSATLQSRVVCQNHFKRDCFTNDMKNKLIKFAVPTMPRKCNEDENIQDNTPSSSSDEVIERLTTSEVMDSQTEQQLPNPEAARDGTKLTIEKKERFLSQKSPFQLLSPKKGRVKKEQIDFDLPTKSIREQQQEKIKKTDYRNPSPQIQCLPINLATVKVEMEEEKEDMEFPSQEFEHVFVKEEYEEPVVDELPNNGFSKLVIQSDGISELFNFFEDVITLEESKPDIEQLNEILELKPTVENNIEASIKSENMTDNAEITIEADLGNKSQTQLRTYSRSKSKRPHSSSLEKGPQNSLKTRKIQDITQHSQTTDVSSSTLQDTAFSYQDINSSEHKLQVTDANCLPSGIPICKCSNDQSNSAIEENSNVIVFSDTINHYVRGHVCLFCKGRFVNLTKHLAKSHREEVQRETPSIEINLSKTPSKVPQLVHLQRIGDFQYNETVLSTGNGQLVVLRPSEKFIEHNGHSDFVPCPDCCGYVFKTQLKRHYTRCVVKDSSLKPLIKRNLLRESYALKMFSTVFNCDGLRFNEQVLTKLQSRFGETAVNDKLIVLLGLHKASFSQRDEDPSKVRLAMQKMGCLLLFCRKLSDNKHLSLQMLLVPEKVKLVLSTVKTLISSNKDLETFELYKSLYPLIVTTVFIWRGQCLVECNLSLAQKALKFYYMFAMGWLNISAFTNKLNVDEQLSLNPAPTIADVIREKYFLKEKVLCLTKELKKAKIFKEVGSIWHDLAEAVIGLTCLFNALDFYALETLTIAEYAVRPDWSVDDCLEYSYKMSRLTYKLALTRTVVCTKYRSRDVMILLTHELKKAIDMLIKKRTQAGVNQSNPFVFASKFSKELPINASNCFYNLCVKEGFLNLAVMEKKKEREYVSYITQLADMTPIEIDWVKEKVKGAKKGKKGLSVLCEANNPLLEVLNIDEIIQAVKENKLELQEIARQPVKLLDFKRENSRINVQKKQKNEIVDQLRVTEGKPRLRPLSLLEKSYISDYFKGNIKLQIIPQKLKCVQCMNKRKTLFSGSSWISVRNHVETEIWKMRSQEIKGSFTQDSSEVNGSTGLQTQIDP